MPKKKSASKAIVPAASRDVVRAFGDEVVRVDAVYHDHSVHPSGAGPWAAEADKIAWTDPMTGYPCIILRAGRGGNLCGYVAVPRSHPLHGFAIAAMDGLGFVVHGGISYAAACQNHEPEFRSICHIPIAAATTRTVYENDAARRHDDAWWFGFQCDQASDVLPNALPRQRKDNLLDGVTDRQYRDEAYVFNECTRLAAQLHSIDCNRPPETSIPPRERPLGYDPAKARR